MKKSVKFLGMLLMAVAMISIATSVLAVDPGSITIDTSDDGGITTIGGKIIGIIQTAGSVVAVAMLVIIGIKYMLGSAEDKAEYKKSLMPYLVGAILIFAASNLASVIYNFAGNIQA